MYYLLVDGVQKGPYPEAGVRAMAANGELNTETMYWQEGMADWRDLAEWISPVVPQTAPSGVRFTGLPDPRSVYGAAEAAMEMKAAATIPRFAAYVVDYGILLGLSFQIPELLGFTKDPQLSVAVVGLLILGAVFRDAIWGGRSLGRRLTGLHLMDLKRNQKATVSQTILRNATQIALLVVPILAIGIVGVVLPFPIVERALAVAALCWLLTVAGSASNELGQGLWDRRTGTSVMKLS